VPALIAESASRNDIRLRSCAPIFASFKMFTGALKKLSLTKRNAVFQGELSRIVQPHGKVAVKAATGLARISDGARVCERLRHEGLR
jgi:hypothetical protein